MASRNTFKRALSQFKDYWKKRDKCPGKKQDIASRQGGVKSKTSALVWRASHFESG